MLKTKFIISSIIFIVFLITTSQRMKLAFLKKNNKFIEWYFIKKKDINETQLDFYYLSSQRSREKLNIIGFNDYSPISNSKIFLNISDFTKINNKISNLKK